MTKKNILAIGLAILMVFALAGCGGSNNSGNNKDITYTVKVETNANKSNISENKDKVDVDLKGVFLVEPDDEDWISALNKDLDEGLCYVLAVYDMKAATKANVETCAYASLLMNDTNEYYQTDGNVNSALRSFLENCGYNCETTVRAYTLLGGGNTQRFCVAFEANKNDFTDNYNGLLSIAYRDCDTEFKVSKEDFRKITCFDDIFLVEDDPNTHQAIHTTYIRGELASDNIKKGPASQLYALSLFKDSDKYRFSCASTRFEAILLPESSKISPSYSLDKVLEAYPDLKDDIDTLKYYREKELTSLTRDNINKFWSAAYSLSLYKY